jgi:hypothetical protein
MLARFAFDQITLGLAQLVPDPLGCAAFDDERLGTAHLNALFPRVVRRGRDPSSRRRLTLFASDASSATSVAFSTRENLTHIRDALKAAAKLGLDLWRTEVSFDAVTGTIKAHYTISPDPELQSKSHGLDVAKQWLTDEQYRRAQAVLGEIKP